ncbi:MULTISPECIES: calcium-binding protein [Streptomyces]|uniref:Calcium-binding protein n=1 Tax=Streptomyces venezuelae TaxID=54571 RepID=A0A5P2BHS7_STRVZ|nr:MULTISPECIES: calcium-binding protein [Streptomyces]NEA02057.1 calcium-binding protein [Streptomyces sp. SID10116]MYY82782.1 calcium-binding protein [Streptomyces sp. SID335]MYZ19131.1 calcium-binding protein [Streptomyces sp. SID337]NDZ83986.1 calcium-binding protein [Streptomyces sp. SID10115]NEB49266.1 calcium-binding protein [Streptomyces sp. SID339]
MRIRATVAALSGTLALSALAFPAAHAADAPKVSEATTFAAKAPADAVEGDTKITKVTVNGGKDIVVGTSAAKTVKISVTATDPSGIEDAAAFLWHGTDFDAEDGIDGSMVPDVMEGDCKVVDATTSTCTTTVVADPNVNIYSNILAGKWKVWAIAQGKDGDHIQKDAFPAGVSVKRAAKLTTNASPEPVKKGKTLTVTGALTRANWDTAKYAGYTKQDVKLQYKKKGASSYTTLKTVKSDTKGNLKTTVKASADGYFRYVFAGTSTTPSVTSTADFVDVR